MHTWIKEPLCERDRILPVACMLRETTGFASIERVSIDGVQGHVCRRC